MSNREQKSNLARTMTVMPRLLHYLTFGFKPEFDIPIKKNELKTLFELSLHPDMPMKHYVEAVDLESGSFTYLTDKLEQKGLVKRVQSKKDKRVTVLSLTDNGREITEEMHDKFDIHLMELIKILDKEDLDNLNHAAMLLESVLRKFENE